MQTTLKNLQPKKSPGRHVSATQLSRHLQLKNCRETVNWKLVDYGYKPKRHVRRPMNTTDYGVNRHDVPETLTTSNGAMLFSRVSLVSSSTVLMRNCKYDVYEVKDSPRCLYWQYYTWGRLVCDNMIIKLRVRVVKANIALLLNSQIWIVNLDSCSSRS